MLNIKKSGWCDAHCAGLSTAAAMRSQDLADVTGQFCGVQFTCFPKLFFRVRWPGPYRWSYPYINFIIEMGRKMKNVWNKKVLKWQN